MDRVCLSGLVTYKEHLQSAKNNITKKINKKVNVYQETIH